MRNFPKQLLKFFIILFHSIIPSPCSPRLFFFFPFLNFTEKSFLLLAAAAAAPSSSACKTICEKFQPAAQRSPFRSETLDDDNNPRQSSSQMHVRFS
jgi:hypothetical protein